MEEFDRNSFVALASLLKDSRYPSASDGSKPLSEECISLNGRTYGVHGSITIYKKLSVHLMGVVEEIDECIPALRGALHIALQNYMFREFRVSFTDPILVNIVANGPIPTCVVHSLYKKIHDTMPFFIEEDLPCVESSSRVVLRYHVPHSKHRPSFIVTSSAVSVMGCIEFSELNKIYAEIYSLATGTSTSPNAGVGAVAAQDNAAHSEHHM